MVRFFKILLICICLLCGAVVLSFGPLFLEDDPRLAAATAPSPEDVAAARQLVRDIRATAGDGIRSGETLEATVTQLNSVIRLGGRFINGFRGRVSIGSGEVIGEVSLPIPWIGGQKWLNLTGHIPPFDKRFALSRVTVGARALPPGPTLLLGRLGANLVMGDNFGDKVLQSASAMDVAGDKLRFNIRLDEVGRNGVMQGTFGKLRGAQMPTATEIEAFHLRIRTAMADGELPLEGSFLPYIEFTLAQVAQHSTPETLPNVYTAAILGLTKACGARDFSMIVGGLAFDDQDKERDWQTSCKNVTFNGRIDSRRHFITSAALQAASNTGVSVSLGEFKELYDSISGAGGFDFTDMAANLSGIRMSNVLMALPQEAWPAMLARLETENDVIVSFDGIPALMPEETFKARYINVDSLAYKAMLDQIEIRIDGLSLYRTP